LRFLLSAGSGFIERTFVVHAGGKLVYHFSNRVNNVDAGPPEMIYLHKKIAPFSIGNDYLAGTIVEDVGDMYAAKKSVNHADNIAVTNLEYWEDVGDQHDEFVNNADLELSRDMNLTQSCFAVIDIWLSGTTGKYRLFDAAGQLLSPVFIISLKSRT
jgi:hypothetical protein